MSIFHTVAPGAFPIKTPQTATGKTALSLFEAWTEGYRRSEHLRREQRDAHDDLRRIESDLSEAHFRAEMGQGDPKQTKTLDTARKAAQERIASDWDARFQAADRAREQRRSQFVAFVDEHLDDLLEEPELADAATAATQAVIAAVNTARGALDNYRAVLEGHRYLLGLASTIDGRSLPTDPGIPGLREAIAYLDEHGDEAVPAPRPTEAALERHRDYIEHGVLEAATVPAGF